jgi:predicted transcriptional regulator
MDFQKITSELLGTGLTEQQLADLVPCSQPTINAFRHGKRGARPSMLIGTRLLELHKQRCVKRRTVAAAQAP